MTVLAGRASLRIPLLLSIAAAGLYLLASSRRDFWSPDEPDFAEHVREMRERGSLLVPYENGKPYSEKPILFYWAMAATTPFTGGDVTPFGARLPSVLSAAFLVFGAAFLAGRRGGDREALLAGAATAVAPITFWQGQFVQTDALFSALLFGALLAMILVEEDPDHAARWVLVLHVLLPLGVLTKGPLALALASLVALVRAASSRSWAAILRLRPFRGALIFVVLVVPWYVLASRAGGREYAYDLVVNQNWNRFFHAFDHVKPWWFYAESIWTDFLPFTIFAVASPLVLRKSDVLERRPEVRFAVVVALTSFLFLSASQAKQGKYLLVAYPFAAVVGAAVLGEIERRRSLGLRLARSYTVLLAGIFLGGALALGPVSRVRMPRFAALAPLLAAPVAVGAIGTGVILFRKRTEVAPAFLALLATLAAGEAAASLVVFPAIDVIKTGRPLYERMRPRVSHGEPLAYFGGTYHCYPILVLRRRTEHVRTEGELRAFFSRTPGALALVDRSDFERFQDPWLRSRPILDRQRVGQDEALLVGGS